MNVDDLKKASALLAEQDALEASSKYIDDSIEMYSKQAKEPRTFYTVSFEFGNRKVKLDTQNILQIFSTVQRALFENHKQIQKQLADLGVQTAEDISQPVEIPNVGE